MESFFKKYQAPKKLHQRCSLTNFAEYIRAIILQNKFEWFSFAIQHGLVMVADQYFQILVNQFSKVIPFKGKRFW